MQRWLGLARSLVIYHNPLTIGAWRRFYAQTLRSGDLVFDVGAHVGSRTRAMRRVGARVVALEPQPLFARYLRMTLPKDVVLIEAAAGGAEAMAEMSVSSRHPTVSSLQSTLVADAHAAPGFAHVRWDQTETVKMLTLDSLIATHGLPAYVKIDVEGFELDVLSGLSKAVPMLSVEYLPEFVHLTEAVITRIEELGPYRFNPVVGERSGFLWSEWRNGDALRDWLSALPADAPSGDLFARLP